MICQVPRELSCPAWWRSSRRWGRPPATTAAIWWSHTRIPSAIRSGWVRIMIKFIFVQATLQTQPESRRGQVGARSCQVRLAMRKRRLGTWWTRCLGISIHKYLGCTIECDFYLDIIQKQLKGMVTLICILFTLFKCQSFLRWLLSFIKSYSLFQFKFLFECGYGERTSRMASDVLLI